MIERVRLLIRQVGATVPPGPGRQQKIAAKIGLSPSMLSKIEREQKSRLQDDTIASILDALDLDPAYLFDESLGAEPDYRMFQRKRRQPALQVVRSAPHWDAFARNWHRFGELTGTERDGMQRMPEIDPDLEIRDWTDWIPLAEWILGRRRRR